MIFPKGVQLIDFAGRLPNINHCIACESHYLVIMHELPILYSFRRCPYAMRARLAIQACGVPVELREVVLRDKPSEMLEASPKGTVPVLIKADGTVIEESFDIIEWALAQLDQASWTAFDAEQIDQMRTLIEESDGPFKQALDHYKYPNRYEGIDREIEQSKGAEFITKLDQMLEGKTYLFGETFSLADGAILPFVRQFAHVDMDWFYGADWKNVIRWLDAFKESDRFKAIMTKYDQWQSEVPGVRFGE